MTKVPLLSERLHALMQGLFFPASLGTCLVMLVLHVVSAQVGQAQSISTTTADPRFWFAVALLLIFTLSYDQTYWCHNYTGKHFVVDLAESIALLVAFSLMGLQGTASAGGMPGPPFYLCLCLVPLLHMAWTMWSPHVNKRIGHRLSIVRWGRFVTFLLAATLLSYRPNWMSPGAVAWLVIGIQLGLVACHVAIKKRFADTRQGIPTPLPPTPPESCREPG